MELQTHFEFLPDEINLQFLGRIQGYSDTLSVCQTPGLAHLCDWDFWRRKVEQEFNVPQWYFDLPLGQKREISPSDRYLEVISKFWLIPESVARIEGEKVEGVYFPHQANKIAARQGNLEIYRLTSTENSPEKIQQVEERIRLKRVGLVLPSDLKIGEFDQDFNQRFSNQFGYDLGEIFNSPQHTDRKEEILRSGENILQLLLQRDFIAIETALENRTSILDVGVLAASGDEQAFSIVERIFTLETMGNKATLLSFSAGSRKPEQFIRLYSLFNSFHISRLSGLLERVYFVAEQTLIEFMRKIIITNDEIIIGSLHSGYLFDPRPVEVYQIVNKEIEVKKRGKDFSLELRGISQMDADIFILAVNDKSSHAENFILEALREEISPIANGSRFPVGAVEYSIQRLKKSNYDFSGEYNLAGPIMKTLFRQYEIDFPNDPFSYHKNLNAPMGKRINYFSRVPAKAQVRSSSLYNLTRERQPQPPISFDELARLMEEANISSRFKSPDKSPIQSESSDEEEDSYLYELD